MPRPELKRTRSEVDGSREEGQPEQKKRRASFSDSFGTTPLQPPHVDTPSGPTGSVFVDAFLDTLRRSQSPISHDTDMITAEDPPSHTRPSSPQEGHREGSPSTADASLRKQEYSRELSGNIQERLAIYVPKLRENLERLKKYYDDTLDQFREQYKKNISNVRCYEEFNKGVGKYFEEVEQKVKTKELFDAAKICLDIEKFIEGHKFVEIVKKWQEDRDEHMKDYIKLMQRQKACENDYRKLGKTSDIKELQKNIEVATGGFWSSISANEFDKADEIIKKFERELNRVDGQLNEILSPEERTRPESSRLEGQHAELEHRRQAYQTDCKGIHEFIEQNLNEKTVTISISYLDIQEDLMKLRNISGQFLQSMFDNELEYADKIIKKFEKELNRVNNQLDKILRSAVIPGFKRAVIEQPTTSGQDPDSFPFSKSPAIIPEDSKEDRRGQMKFKMGASIIERRRSESGNKQSSRDDHHSGS